MFVGDDRQRMVRHPVEDVVASMPRKFSAFVPIPERLLWPRIRWRDTSQGKDRSRSDVGLRSVLYDLDAPGLAPQR